MKLSVSQIALKDYSWEEAIRLLKATPVRGIEVAPYLLFDDPLASSKKERQWKRRDLEKQGLQMMGMHALFFGRPELRLFDSAQLRQQTLEHLTGMIHLCADMGGTVLSFGALAVRRKGNLNDEEAFEIAIPFFRKVSDEAQTCGVVVCFEPSASFYGCDFMTTTDESAAFVSRVGHSHFRLLWDMGTVILNRKDPKVSLQAHREMIAHIHINDPELHPPGAKGVDHREIPKTLSEIGYEGWLTLEFLKRGVTLEKDWRYSMECYEPVCCSGKRSS